MSIIAQSAAQHAEKLTFLALGDSYTIGEAVSENERWPHLLQAHLNNEGFDIQVPEIIATTGWTTDELKAAIQEKFLEGNRDLVSLLIGVNNQYRGFPMKQYRREFRQLLETAIQLARDNDPLRVFVVSIPDYGITPFAAEKGKDAEKIVKELDEYNAWAAKIASKLGVRFYDITAISRKAAYDSTLLAEDGLHPSGKMYTQWVSEKIAEGVKVQLERIIQ